MTMSECNSNLILLGLLALAVWIGWSSSAAGATPIVNYGGTNLVAANANGVLPTPTITGLKKTYPYSAATAITPASGYTGIPIYGAFETEVTAGSAVNGSLQWANNTAGDRINSFATWATGSGTLTLSGLVFINQADFTDLNSGAVMFDAASSMTVNIFLLTNTNNLPRSVRFAVLNGGTWYLSSSSTNSAGMFTIANLAAENFGAWNSPTNIPFSAVPTSFATTGNTLSNIQAVGIYFLSSRDGSGLAQCMLQSLTVSAASAAPSPVDAINSTVLASPASVPADGISTSTITVTLKDAANNAVSNKPVTLASSRGAPDTISAASGLSATNGVATFTVKSLTTGAPVFTATGDGVTLAQQPAVTFTATAAGAVFEKMKNGICVGEFDEFPNNASGNNNEEYMSLVKRAGFKSIRLFNNASQQPGYRAGVVSDALDQGLVVNLCMFAFAGTTKEQYVAKWKAVAEYYAGYSNDLVFEMLNEPRLAPGLTNNVETMDWVNAAVAEVRAVSPTRLLLIGGPQYLQPNFLSDYVTPAYLTYAVNGISFTNDPNVFGAFHHYVPSAYTMPHGATNTLADFPTWQTTITNGLDEVAAWSATWTKRAVLTEWGAQNDLKEPADLQTYTQFFAQACDARNIPWLYYCGVPKTTNSQDAVLRWSIFTLQNRSWDVGVVYYLTGADVSGGPGVSSMILTGGQVDFQINGPYGRGYIIQASTNLTSWSDLCTTNPSVLPFQWSDPDAGNFQQRFYRIKLVP